MIALATIFRRAGEDGVEARRSMIALRAARATLAEDAAKLANLSLDVEMLARFGEATERACVMTLVIEGTCGLLALLTA